MSWTLILVSLFVYMLPSVVTAYRHPPSPASVVVVNVFLGWTFIGWVVALAMAFRDPKPKPALMPPAVPKSTALETRDWWKR